LPWRARSAPELLRHAVDPVSALPLSVVIPAFNEESRLPPYLSSIVGYLERRGGGWEIIVVDDGSRDATQAVVRAVMATCPSVRLIPHGENRGKGAAVRTGMLAATGALRLFCDADGATPFAELDRLERAVTAGADIAIGSRAIRGRDTKVEGTLHRKFLGTVYNGLVRLIAVPGLHDTQCGFKLFRGEVAERIFEAQRLSGFGFDVEVLFLARQWGYVLREVPVNWRDRPGGKVRLLRDSIRMFLDLVKLRRSWTAGVYRVPAQGLRRAAGSP
jgi:dolichyl-phosphate beta-glucosyltransferase